MTDSRGLRVVNAVLLVATLLVACAGGDGGRAVAVLDDSPAASCTPADEAGRAVFGLSGVRNVSDSTAEVNDVELIDPEGMELLGFELRAIDDQDAHIVGLDYDHFGPSSIALPTDLAAGEEYVTLVGVRVPPGERGSADGVSLSFSGDGGSGIITTLITMRVVPVGDDCAMGE